VKNEQPGPEYILALYALGITYAEGQTAHTATLHFTTYDADLLSTLLQVMFGHSTFN
jgi:hypothetical protein